VDNLFVDLKKVYVSVRREVLYNILIEFDIPMKQVRLIKMYLNETYSRAWEGTNLSDMFRVKHGLIQGDALSPLLFNFALVCAMRRFQVNQNDLHLNGTHQLFVCADGVNILGESVHTMMKNTGILIVASRTIGLEVSADKTKNMVMSQDQNAG
jgi:hypothetical protein